jgi:hypothetical protein
MNQQQKNTPLEEIKAGCVTIEVTGTGEQCIETINLLLADGYKLSNVTNTEGRTPFVYHLSNFANSISEKKRERGFGVNQLTNLFKSEVEKQITNVKETCSTYEEALLKVSKMQIGTKTSLEEKIKGYVLDAVKERIYQEAMGKIID